MIFRRVVFLMLIIMLAGCAAIDANGPTFTPAAAPGDDQALLYIYRPRTPWFSGRAAIMKLDDKPLLELLNNGYTHVYLRPGNHKITHNWDASLMDAEELRKPLTITVNLMAKQTYYVEMFSEGVDTGMRAHYHWKLRLQSDPNQIAKIKDCKFQPLNATKPN